MTVKEYVIQNFTVTHVPSKEICDELVNQMAQVIVSLANTFDRERVMEFEWVVFKVGILFVPTWGMLGFAVIPDTYGRVTELLNKLEVLSHLLNLLKKQNGEKPSVLMGDGII